MKMHKRWIDDDPALFFLRKWAPQKETEKEKQDQWCSLWNFEKSVQLYHSSDSMIVDCPNHLGFKFWVSFPQGQIPQGFCGGHRLIEYELPTKWLITYPEVIDLKEHEVSA